MMYSGNFAQTVSYAIGAAVADGPLGPFTRYPDNPLLEPTGDLLGLGHHGLVEGPDGRTLVFHHAKNDAEVPWNRHIRVTTLAWEDDEVRFVPAVGD